jgi:ABC-type multidrug transport system ATPase subunit
MTNSTTDWALEADGLVKVFGANRAVDGVDLQVRTGAVYGVLGPNGAGKTTTINMLATLLRRTAAPAACSGTTSSESRTSCGSSSASPGSSPRSTRRSPRPRTS